MNYQTKAFLGAGLLVLFAMPLQAEQIVLTPILDATLYEDAEGDLANGGGDHLFFGQVGPNGDEELRRTLVKFDLSSIPAEARIDSVNVSFYINKTPMTDAVGGEADLHRVTSSWGEGTTIAFGDEGTGGAATTGSATWQHRFYPSTAWASAGGDYIPTPSGSAGYGVSLEFLEFTSNAGLTADVTSWVRNPSSNHGWILIGPENAAKTARRIYARESVGESIPSLTVNWFIPSPTENLELTEIATGLSRPVAIANANDGSGRLFIIEQPGRIRIFDTTTQTLLPTPYLDIEDEVDDSGNEQGLLGLAFHPNFASNRKLYVYYTRDPGDPSDRSVVAMYQQDENSNNAVDEGTKQVLMEFTQNADNHNGGDMHFGADGYLYIASGDGGGGNDTYNNAQNVNTLKGKILRIDVDGTPPGGGELCGLDPQYGIPPGNAFPGAGNGCDEILHMGLRNPWKFSFDAKTEDMYIGDVGQGSWEEVDFAPANSSSLNFGWPCREGAHVFRNDVTCPNAVDPIFEYSSVGECSVTGGYVYRGASTAMSGYYVYGDYCTERIWLARQENNSWTSVEFTDAASVLTSLSAFGQDEQCELYVADLDAGKVYRIDDDEMIQNSGFESLRCQ